MNYNQILQNVYFPATFNLLSSLFPGSFVLVSLSFCSQQQFECQSLVADFEHILVGIFRWIHLHYVRFFQDIVLSGKSWPKFDQHSSFLLALRPLVWLFNNNRSSNFVEVDIIIHQESDQSAIVPSKNDNNATLNLREQERRRRREHMD